MNWRFWRRETRQASEPYTDAIVRAIQAAAAGTDDAAIRTATIEACAGLWSRAFASATVQGFEGLKRRDLATIGRRLCESGEAIYLIDVGAGGLTLQEAQSWEIHGRAGAWQYELTLTDPSFIRTVHRMADSVLHFQFATLQAEPWRGVGPIGASDASRDAHKRLEKSVKDEANRSTGGMIPVPDTAQTEGLQADIQNLEGKIVLVPSVVGGWDIDSQARQARADWAIKRSGPEFTPAEVEMRMQLADGIAGACGVPPILIRADGDGTGYREGFRQFLHASVQPQADLVAEELSEKLEREITINFDRIFAADLQGRARAFGSMVQGGLAMDKAAQLAGLGND